MAVAAPPAPTAMSKPETKPASKAPVASVEPASASHALDAVDYVFTDPARVPKLAASLVNLDAWTKKRAQELDVAGLLVGVVIDDQVVALSGAGYQNSETLVPITGQSVFRVGSITKPMTAMAILQLRDQNKLRLDAAASDYLPELLGVRAKTTGMREIRVRDLLMHTSGLPREGATVDDTDGKGTSERALLASLDGIELEFEPGSRYQYSNFGFSLLGVIIARVSGQSYRNYMREKLFAPLGLQSATWDAESVPQGRLAEPHRRDASGEFKVDPTPAVFGAREPSGGLFISGADFGHFLAWQLTAYAADEQGEPRVLRAATRREAHQPGRFIGLSVQKASKGKPWVANAEASFIGYSWHGYQNCEFDQVVFHNGLVHTYGTDAAMLPAYGVGVFAFANTLPADVASVRRELLERLRHSGALLPRVARAKQAPRLQVALERLLQVYNAWDPEKYQAMLSERHKQGITQEREQEELEEYRELHGSCRAGPMLSYVSQNQARYLLECDKARLEMALYLNPENGLIDGFVGHSSGVEPIRGAKEAARTLSALLNRWQPRVYERLFAPSFGSGKSIEQTAAGLARAGPCKLGPLIERDGNRNQRFSLKCRKGPRRELSLHLLDGDPSKIDGFSLDTIHSGPCAER